MEIFSGKYVFSVIAVVSGFMPLAFALFDYLKKRKK